MAGRRVLALISSSVLALSLAGCSSAVESAGTSSSPQAGFVSSSEPHQVSGCLQEGDTALVLDAPGVPTEALTFGDGPRTVILAHQAEQGPCAWDAYGRTLAERGYRVFIPSLTASPEDVMSAAVAWLGAAGVSEYAMVGASMGGAYVLSTAGELNPAPSVVVAISSPAQYNDIDALAGIRAITQPILLVAGTGDDDFADQARRLAEAQPDAHVLLVDSSAHGTALLATDTEVAAAVEAALTDAIGNG